MVEGEICGILGALILLGPNTLICPIRSNHENQNRAPSRSQKTSISLERKSLTTVQHSIALSFTDNVEPEAKQIIEEEVIILAQLREHLANLSPQWRDVSYDDSLLELRDSLAEAREDEIAQIVTQMDSLASLSTHLDAQVESQRVLDTDSPYFGHMRVRQEGRTRDVLMGNITLTTGQMPFPIVDWRHAPISRIFYSYREGEEFEEEFGGRAVEGEILAHRKVLILKGTLLRVECAQGIFQLGAQGWEKLDQAPLMLEGGQGSAVRPASLSPLEFGAGPSAGLLTDKRLALVTGLLDQEQFNLITQPDSGVVVIDGGAGSGKTTIALHRLAYLAYENPRRFQPSTMLNVVFTPALAAYIKRLLEALGLPNSRTEIFENFMATLRRRHFPGLKVEYTEATPSTLLRFKQHPVVMQLLRERRELWAREFRLDLAQAMTQGTAQQLLFPDPSADACLQAWDSLADRPLALRLKEFTYWVLGRGILPHIGKFPHGWVVQKRLRDFLAENCPTADNPQELVLTIWMEAFLNLAWLSDALSRNAPGEFSPSQIVEIRDWSFRFYSSWEDAKNPVEREMGILEEEGQSNPAPDLPQLDHEDDTLLLLLYREMVGPLRGRKNRDLKVQHLMVDEAQDFSPLDLRVLIDLAAEPRSITLAGDTDQRMVLQNSFTRWEDVLEQLNLPSKAIKPLQVGYRSTRQIMDFARAVLGPLARERPWRAVRDGAPVSLFRNTDAGQTVAMLSDALLSLMQREPQANVAVIARYPEQADIYHEGLVKADLPRLKRVRDYGFTFKPGVEVTDIAQVKGLEFDYVVLVDADASTYPDEPAARYMLHVGATRAAHQLWLISAKQPSPIIPANVNHHFM